MGKEITVLIGYMPNHKSLTYGTMEVIAEVETGGTDYDGRNDNEVIGVAKDNFGLICMYRGGKDMTTFDKVPAIFLSEEAGDLSELLHQLADKLKDAKNE